MNINHNINLNEVDSKQALNIAEAQVIQHVHEKSRYNQSRTARELGISRGTLRTKLNEYFPGRYI